MAPEVTETLLGRLPASQSAWLYHLCSASSSSDTNGPKGMFRRYPVRNQVYPGLIYVSKDNGDSGKERKIRGVLYSGLTPKEMARLDWFEDTQYSRTKVSVSLTSVTGPSGQATQSGEMVDTETYLWTDPVEDLDIVPDENDQDWSYQDFRQRNLQWYLENTVIPCRRQLDQAIPLEE